MTEQPQAPTLPSHIPETPSDESLKPSTPPSPSTSITTMSDFTIADGSDDEPIPEPDTITPHDTFYLEDGGVEVLCGKILFRIHASALSFHSPVLRKMFSLTNLAAAESPNGCPRIVSSDMPVDFATLLKIVYLPEWVPHLNIESSPVNVHTTRFQNRTKTPDFSTFSSLLRVSSEYEMLSLRARLLETIRDAYPETFEGLGPSKVLGEHVFDGPKPHPNAVLNLFIQQMVTSALPMAYYMAARRGSDSLMDTRLPPSATLSGQTLRSAMRGLMALREMELKETYQIAFTIKDPANGIACSSLECFCWRGVSDGRFIRECQQVFDRITGSAVGGTRILQVLSASELTVSELCQECADKMRVGHAEVRRKAWAALPEVFGLRV